MIRNFHNRIKKLEHAAGIFTSRPMLRLIICDDDQYLAGGPSVCFLLQNGELEPYHKSPSLELYDLNCEGCREECGVMKK